MRCRKFGFFFFYNFELGFYAVGKNESKIETARKHKGLSGSKLRSSHWADLNIPIVFFNSIYLDQMASNK